MGFDKNIIRKTITVKEACEVIQTFYTKAKKNNREIKNQDKNDENFKEITAVNRYNKDGDCEQNYTNKGAYFLRAISSDALALLDYELDAQMEWTQKFKGYDADGQNGNKMHEYGQAEGFWSDGPFSVAIVAALEDASAPFSIIVRTYITAKNNKLTKTNITNVNSAVDNIMAIISKYAPGNQGIKVACECDESNQEIAKIIKVYIEYKKGNEYRAYNEIVNDIFYALVRVKAFNRYIQTCVKTGKASEDMHKKVDDLIWSLKCAEDLEWNLSPTVLQINDLVFNDCKQIVMTGAPGTGKTYSAKEYIRWQLISQHLKEIYENNKEEYNKKSESIKKALKNNDEGNVIKKITDGSWSMVQFHPSFDYTDFVEGLRPVKVQVEDGKTNTSFVRMDGVFKKFCRQAIKAKSSDNRFFFIDEINRADLSKVFGELMFCLEEGYRGPEHTIQTQYSNLDTHIMDEEKGYAVSLVEAAKAEKDKSKEKVDVFEEGFYIPNNVIVIGSMNDIDRSVDTFDFALRRRFRWHKVRVDEGLLRTTFESMKRMNSSTELSDEDYGYIEDLVNAVTEMNNVFKQEAFKRIFRTPEDFFIGPAYFGGLFKGDTKSSVWANKVEPILREYVRGRDNAEEFINACKFVYNGNGKVSDKKASNNIEKLSEDDFKDMFNEITDDGWKDSVKNLCGAIEDVLSKSEITSFVDGFNIINRRKGIFNKILNADSDNLRNNKEKIADSLAANFVRKSGNNYKMAKELIKQEIENCLNDN